MSFKQVYFPANSASPRDQEAIRGRRSSRTRQHLPVRRGRWRLILSASRKRAPALTSSYPRVISPLRRSRPFRVLLFGKRRATRQQHGRRVSDSPPWRGKNGARRLKGGCARAARNYERDTNSYCRYQFPRSFIASLSLRKKRKGNEKKGKANSLEAD